MVEEKKDSSKKEDKESQDKEDNKDQKSVTKEKTDTKTEENGKDKKESKKDKTEEKEKKSEAKKDEKETEDKKEEEEVEIPEKFKGIVEKIEGMKVAELAELVKILEKKFGVSAVPQIAAQVGATGAAGAEGGGAKEEKSAYNIELTDIGSQKIQVIKAVRDITGKGLKDSKGIVDKAADSPQVIKENVKKEEAEEMKEKFEKAGAKVELK